MQRTVEIVDGGATAVEYALMVGLIATAVVAAVTALGMGVLGLFNSAALLIP